ncbi:methylosome subunit pICln [Drosophila guanche]|uniref:Blast:Methylosome subunit pICln n=1 Tax=Drosophila guanche TaxID=7266 RepID=A0A3B0J1Y8_DROGU|nr:methylosome subunit pICln [Drosophila guanche]SPP75045.1 blast:Methylosome subunit pICln [Drosophila guanche]
MVLITPVSAPEHGLLYTANNIKLKMGDNIVGEGTIYIAQNSLSFQPSDLPDGISIEWKQVSLHGISSNPRKCIYFMLDHKVEWNGVYGGNPQQLIVNGQNGGGAEADVDEGNGSDEHDEDDENFEDAVDEQFEEVTECWLLPEDIHTVDTMYRAMTMCQAMHPDSADSNSEDSDPMEDAGGMVLEDQDMADDALTLGRNGGEVGGMQNLTLDDDDERFEDADE